MKLLPTKASRETLSWLGSGAVVVIGGLWTAFTYLHDDKKPGTPAMTVTSPSGSVIAPGSTFNGPVNTFDPNKNREQIDAAVKPLADRYDRLAAAVARDKGLEPAPLRTILIKLGEKGVRDEDIPMLLDKKAEELIVLRKKLAELQNGPQDLVSSARHTQELLDKGDFRGALDQLNEYQLAQLSDYQMAMSIKAQIQSDAQKNLIERQQIMKQIETTIFSIQQDLKVHDALTQDKVFRKFEDYIRN